MPRKTKHNSLTTPELIAQVNKENMRLKKDFLDYLISTQHSEGTINGYSHDLDIFFVWNLQNNDNKRFVGISKRNLVAYQNWLIQENENSPARVKRLKAALSSFSNFIENLCDDEYPDFRPIVKKVASPVNSAVRQKSVFTDEELKTLLDALVAEGRFDQACFVSLAMNSGRRKAELLRFKVSYFDDKNLICGGSLYKTPEKVKTKGRGINGKQLTLYTLAREFKPYLDLWLADRERLGVNSDWLFPKNVRGGKWEDEPMNMSTVTSWANKFSRITGKDWYPHSMRHYAATRLYGMNVPEGVIQSMFGWSSADMVRVYLDIDDEKEFEKYFGEDGIKSDITKTSLSDL